ncbi:MAG: hypothetical protein OEO71_03895 [Gammaproteobacteria bacterium]|nr:hypothetical protein [Gammaproteobacteria bacterium]
MAIDQKHLDLINADIDGEIRDSDRRELRAFLAESVEGRALHEELASLCSTLDAVDAIDPPPHMRHVIMSSMKPARTKPESPGFFQKIFAIPALTHSVTFAAGIFLTLSLLHSGQISTGAFDDVTGLVGTIADPIDAEVLGAVAFDKPEVAGKVALRRSGAMLILDMDLVAVRPIEVEADYTDRTIWFNGFAQLESSGTKISAETGRIRLGMDGKRRFAVYLQNKGGRETTVKLRFLAGGKVVHEASLDYMPTR